MHRLRLAQFPLYVKELRDKIQSRKSVKDLVPSKYSAGINVGQHEKQKTPRALSPTQKISLHHAITIFLHSLISLLLCPLKSMGDSSIIIYPLIHHSGKQRQENCGKFKTSLVMHTVIMYQK